MNIVAPRQKKDSGSPGKSPKKKKKKNPWSDDEEEEIIDDISDEDMDGSFRETIIPRDTTNRRAAGRT